MPTRSLDLAPPVCFTALQTDPYYGFKSIARVCTHFILHNFGAAPVAGEVPPLDRFIAYVLYRTRYPQNIAFTALYLLGHLKQRFHNQLKSKTGLSGHRLFLAAFMIASKSAYDSTYANSSFASLAKGFATLKEVNGSEREMLRLLGWNVNVPPETLSAFEKRARSDFGGMGPYPMYTYPMSKAGDCDGIDDAPVQPPLHVLAPTSIPGTMVVQRVSPTEFLPPESTVSRPTPFIYRPAPQMAPQPIQVPSIQTTTATTAIRQIYQAPLTATQSMKPTQQQPQPLHHRAATIYASHRPTAPTGGTVPKIPQVQRSATVPVAHVGCTVGYATGMSSASAAAAAPSSAWVYVPRHRE